MPQTENASPTPAPVTGQGGKGITGRPTPSADEIQRAIRKRAAVEIAHRTAQFNTGTVQKHPHVVAGLVRSSLSTTKLSRVARQLDAAYDFAVAKNTTFALHHDPAMYRSDYAAPADEESAVALEEQRIRTELEGANFQEAVAILGGPGRIPLSLDERIHNAAVERVSGGNPVAALAGGFQAPFSAAFGWAGDTLDTIGHIPGVGAIVRPLHATADVTLGALEENAARAGRLLGDIPAAGAMAVSEIRNREGDVDTDWGALLDFWRLDHHDPFTTGVANTMGYHVDDPEFAETAKSIDIIAGVVEQVALAKVMVGVHGKLSIPGEMGGLLDARTWADHNILNGGAFSKLAALLENSPPSLRVGRILGSTRNISPRLAKAFADAFEVGKTGAGKVANMKQVFVDVVKNDAERAETRLKAVRDARAADPSNPLLRAEQTALESELETISAHEPIAQWPRYQDVRGMLKGVEPVTRGGKIIRAMYDRRPFQAVTDVTKTVDNVRSKPRLYDWDRPNAVKDAMRQNAQNAARWLRGARVPEPVVSELLGEMTSGIAFDDWYHHVTQAVADHAPNWANPVQVKQITSALRNEEVFTNRSNYTTLAADGSEVRRPIVEKANGVTPPTQLNELAHGADLPDVQLVHDITAELARTKHNPGVAWVKKQFDNIMAGWRAQTIVSRGPAISLSIQGEEGLMRFFTNRLQPGRLTDWLVHKLPLSEEAQAAVADRLGLTDLHEARRIYQEMKKHPEMLGQTMGEVAAERRLRIEAPTKRFKYDFMSGAVDPESALAREVFADWVWEIEHTATSADTRALLNHGVEQTARWMEGDTGLGRRPADVVSNNQIPSQFGDERYYYHTSETGNAGGIKARGLDPTIRTNEGSLGTHFTELPEQYPIIGDRPMNVYRVLRDAVPDATRRSEADVFTETHIPARDLEVWTDEGWKPVLDSSAGSADLQRMGEHIIRDTETDPTYAGMEPGERVREFLTRKEEQLSHVAGGNPEVADLMATGRTKAFRLEDPDGELSLVQDELEQLHRTQGDPLLTSEGMRRALIDRRRSLLEGQDELGKPRRLQVTKNNRAIRDWLMQEAQEGRYEMPEYRRTLMSKSAYETSEGLHRGFLSRVQRVQYGVMRFMNRDAMRAGFSEDAFLKWRKRYLKLGWTEKEASSGAVAQAMFEARDWLHDIGNKSSFQRFLRNEMPFYHAWERVAYRWLVKVPNMMGAGFTPLGWGIEANIVNGTIDALKQVGVIQEVKQPDGSTELHTYLPNPIALLDWIPGIEVPNRIDVFDPKTALFPPLHLLSHPPGLAPQTLFALSAVEDLTHVQWLKDFHDEVTMDGALSLQFPGAAQATKIWEAVTGDVPPWAIGHSKNYQEYVVGRARDAALRYAYTEMAATGDLPPNPADYEHQPEYAAARDNWWSRWTKLADQYQTGLSLTNLLAVESPLTSFKPTTEEEVAWKTFLQENGLMGERTAEDWRLIDDYLADHPESLAYNVGAYSEDSKWPKDEGYEAFKNAVGRGDIKLLSQADFRAKLALAQEWEYKNKSDAIALKAAGLEGWNKWSPRRQLLNYGEYQDATRPAWDNFQEFLDANLTAKKLYEEHRSKVSEINDRIQEVRQEQSYSSDPGAFDKALRDLYAKRAEATDYGTTTADHVKWYRNVVMNKWYEKTGALYDRIDTLEASGAPGADEAIQRVYDKVRDINANWEPVVGPDGKKYPTPEEYAYASKPDDERKAQRTKWASVPPSWLSLFQYETTYGKADGKTKQYFAQEETVTAYFDEKTADLSHSSNEYQAWVRWREKSLDILAARADTEEIRRLEKAPKIVRMSAAGLVPDSDGMRWVVDQAQAIATRLAAHGSNQWSSSEEAQYYRGWLESYISKMRDPSSPLYDARVDRFFTRQQHETGLTFDPALYRFVLFGITGTFELDIDYSAENKAATA